MTNQKAIRLSILGGLMILVGFVLGCMVMELVAPCEDCATDAYQSGYSHAIEVLEENQP